GNRPLSERVKLTRLGVALNFAIELRRIIFIKPSAKLGKFSRRELQYGLLDVFNRHWESIAQAMGECSSKITQVVTTVPRRSEPCEGLVSFLEGRRGPGASLSSPARLIPGSSWAPDLAPRTSMGLR